MKENKSFITLPKWHRLLMKAMSIGLVCFFVFAVVLYLLYDPGVYFDRKLYITQFIVIPTVSQLIIVSIFGITLRYFEKYLSDSIMTFILSVCVTTYLGIMVAVHNSVPEMSILLIYPIFGATIYNRHREMIIQGFVSMAAYIVIKSIIIPNFSFYTPVNTNRTYAIIFFGLNVGAVIISYLLRQVSIEMMNTTLAEKIRLEHAVKTDQMTGLYNHRTFYDVLEAKVSTSNADSTFSVIIFDIDNFKKINDKYGHALGDKIILKAVEIIKESISDSDMAFRYGGEEFAIIADNIDEETALGLGMKIVELFRTRKNPPEFSGEVFTLSSGVAQFRHDNPNASELFKKADAALYYVKNHGKNNCASISMVTEP